MSAPLAHVATHFSVASKLYVMHQGPIKRPRRSLEKVWRKFHGDARSLTDIVRCSVLVNSVALASRCLHSILLHSHPVLPMTNNPTTDPENEKSVEGSSSRRLFLVTKVRDQFSVAAETGRRSITLNLEVAWDGAAGSRLVSLQSLCAPAACVRECVSARFVHTRRTICRSKSSCAVLLS